MIEPDDVIVFQGDSITACGRDVANTAPNDSAALGRGYVLHAAGPLLAQACGAGLKIYNRGISGNRIADLKARWQRDCLDLNPTVVSILVGINDIVTCLGGEWGTPQSINQFEDDYVQILTQTREALPDVRIIICEMFSLPCGEVTLEWQPICDARRATASRMAAQFSATFVPFQQTFDRAVQRCGMSAWSADGVHPTTAGYYLMAQSWLQAVGQMRHSLVECETR